MPPAPGTRLRDLVLLAPLGRGAQGAVWRARSETTGAVVALKVMRLRGGRESERARREARALAQLAHPSLPRCMRTLEDEASGLLGLELELVDGFDLGQPGVALDQHARRMALRHVAGALQHLHAAGVVHRDVKPSNVVVARDFGAHVDDPSRCKLVDLGIAVTTGNPSPLTATGHPGTVAFMPPEALDPATFPAAQGRPTLDVFAFGVTGWVLLRGKHPTGLPMDADGEDFAQAYADHTEAEHLFLPPEDLDDPFERVLAACLRLRPDGRPQDGRALVALLDDALAPGRDAAAARDGTRTRAPATPAVARAGAPPGAPAPTLLAAQPPRLPPGPTLEDAGAPMRPRVSGRHPVRAREVALIIGLLGATAGVIALASGGPGADPAAASAAATRGPIATSTPRSSDTPASPAALPTRPPIHRSAEPPDAWDLVGESNVRFSTALGCETKVLDGWFRARCGTAPGEKLRVTAPPAVGARIEHGPRFTTVLVPLRGHDVTLTFDWIGTRGMRELRIAGFPAEHRTVQLQGEFSAP